MAEIPFGEKRILKWDAVEAPLTDPSTINPRFEFSSGLVTFSKMPGLLCPSFFLAPLEPGVGGYPNDGFIYAIGDNGESETSTVEYVVYQGQPGRLYEVDATYNPSYVTYSNGTLTFTQGGFLFGTLATEPARWDLDFVEVDETSILSSVNCAGGDVASPGFDYAYLNSINCEMDGSARSAMLIYSDHAGSSSDNRFYWSNDGGISEMTYGPGMSGLDANLTIILSPAINFNNTTYLYVRTTGIGGDVFGIFANGVFEEYTFATNDFIDVYIDTDSKMFILNENGPYFYYLLWYEFEPGKYWPYVMEIHCAGLHYNIIEIQGNNQAAIDYLDAVANDSEGVVSFDVWGNAITGNIIVIGGSF